MGPLKSIWDNFKAFNKPDAKFDEAETYTQSAKQNRAQLIDVTFEYASISLVLPRLCSRTIVCIDQ